MCEKITIHEGSLRKGLDEVKAAKKERNLRNWFRWVTENYRGKGSI